MIRSIAHNPDGTPYVLLGLTAENVEKLVRDGQPLVVNLSRLVPDQPVPLPDISVAVFYATAEAVDVMKAKFGESYAAPQTNHETNEGEHRDDSTDDGEGTGRTRAERERNRRGARRRSRRT